LTWFTGNVLFQERLYEEVKDLDATDYDATRDSPLLDAAIMETIRFYFVTPNERECVKDYKLPGTDFVVPKGMVVQVIKMLTSFKSIHIFP